MEIISKLCYQGYMYTKQATRKTNQWWKCVKRSSIGCRGNLSTTLQNENPVPGQPHNHAPSDTSIKYSKTRNATKDLATNTRDKPNQIFAQVVSQYDDNVQALLPREENTKRTIRYSVQLLQSQPSMQMSDCLRSTQQQQFLQYDNGQNAENRMLVFYSPDGLERLANAQTFFIFMDGTHLNSYTPSGFHSKM